MPTLFDGSVHVHYCQVYVESRVDDFFEGMDEALAGQVNGLCGAAVPGLLYLTTGLHTGRVGFTVELHDREPPVGDEWEDVVEVSFRPESARSALVEWAAEDAWPLALTQADYRVRYCGSGMDAGRERDTRLDEEPELDRYLLQFWPGAPGLDRVVRQTSQIAGYWHGEAAKTRHG
jgi:hypothetical protein